MPEEGLVYAGCHAFVVLVQYDVAPEQLAEKHKWCVFQEGDAMAGDGQIAGGRAEGEEQPERAEPGSSKAPQLRDDLGKPIVPYFIGRTGCGEVDIAAFEFLVDGAVAADLVAHHALSMHGGGQVHDEEDFFRFIFFAHSDLGILKCFITDGVILQAVLYCF